MVSCEKRLRFQLAFVIFESNFAWKDVCISSESLSIAAKQRGKLCTDVSKMYRPFSPGSISKSSFFPGLLLSKFTYPLQTIPGLLLSKFTYPLQTIPGLLLSKFTYPLQTIPGLLLSKFTYPLQTIRISRSH